MTISTPPEGAASKPRRTSVFQALMTLHWWMAGFYGILMLTGTIMSKLERGAPFRVESYEFHKSLGLLVLALLLWRILLLLQVWWKKYSRRWPRFTGAWWRTFALHASLYLFMVAVPMSGVLLSNAFRPNNVKFFGLPLPDLWAPSRPLTDLGRSLHFWLSYVFLAFILLHTLQQWKVVKANIRRLRQFLDRRRSA